MEEVTDEPLYRDRVCGIDIGKAGLVATIRVPSDGDRARRADPEHPHTLAARSNLAYWTEQAEDTSPGAS